MVQSNKYQAQTVSQKQIHGINRRATFYDIASGLRNSSKTWAQGLRGAADEEEALCGAPDMGEVPCDAFESAAA